MVAGPRERRGKPSSFNAAPEGSFRRSIGAGRNRRGFQFPARMRWESVVVPVDPRGRPYDRPPSALTPFAPCHAAPHLWHGPAWTRVAPHGPAWKREERMHE